MSMLLGWVSPNESYPVSRAVESFRTGVESLSEGGYRRIVEGDGGTVFGLAMALSKSEIGLTHPLRQLNGITKDLKNGNLIKIEEVLDIGEKSWFTIRTRLKNPDVIEDTLRELNLSNILVHAALGMITARKAKIDVQKVDESAPIQVSPNFVGATVGWISDLVTKKPELGIQASPMDARELMQLIDRKIDLSNNTNTHDVAQMQNEYLLNNFANLPFALHWVLLDPYLRFAHAVHSEEPNGKHRADPYLSIGKNANGTIAFASEKVMIESAFGIMNVESPSEGQVRTIFAQIGN